MARRPDHDLNLSIKCLELFVEPKEITTETASAKNTPNMFLP